MIPKCNNYERLLLGKTILMKSKLKKIFSNFDEIVVQLNA